MTVEYRDYVLAELRAANIRARLLLNEINRIGVALRCNMVDADTAMAWLHEVGALGFIQAEVHESAGNLERGESESDDIAMP